MRHTADYVLLMAYAVTQFQCPRVFAKVRRDTDTGQWALWPAPAVDVCAVQEELSRCKSRELELCGHLWRLQEDYNVVLADLCKDR
jgi:hypothetical protein